MAAAILSAGLAGCGAVLGPIVVDVYPDEEGNVVVERCYLDITDGGSFTRYELNDCSRKRIVFEDQVVPPQPKAKGAAPAEPPPTPEEPPAPDPDAEKPESVSPFPTSDATQ